MKPPVACVQQKCGGEGEGGGGYVVGVRDGELHASEHG